MKNTIVKLLMLSTALLLLCPAALCQTDPPAGIVIEDGWMTGSVTARFGAGTEYESHDEIKVDCPLPPMAYPAEILTVGEGYVSKKQMQTALKAAGQSTQGRFVNSRGSAIYTGDWNAEASADITKEEAAAQAVEIARRYFEALGVEVELASMYTSRPYDYDTWMEWQKSTYAHRYSDPSTFIENAKAQWKRTSKYNPKQSEYTSVTFYILLDGMLLDMYPIYPAGYADESDAWICTPTDARAIVSDSGILVEAACDLLEIKSRRPLEGDALYASFLEQHQSTWRKAMPGKSWQEALSTALSDCTKTVQFQKNSKDEPYQNQYMDEPITSYGSKTVITSIFPVLHTISENEWAPFWNIESMREYSDGWRE